MSTPQNPRLAVRFEMTAFIASEESRPIEMPTQATACHRLRRPGLRRRLSTTIGRRAAVGVGTLELRRVDIAGDCRVAFRYACRKAQRRSGHQGVAMAGMGNDGAWHAGDDKAGLGLRADGPGVGARAAAVYALVAHRLSTFYDHGHWITQAQGAALCSEWLMRSKQTLSLAERKHLADLSDQVATQIRDSLSREAGLFTAHELMESLDPRYVSELGASIMEECVRVLKAG